MPHRAYREDDPNPRQRFTVNGILNINKPRGMTSFGVVARVKRLTGIRRVGHAGTLDPEATGVLPVCLGQGTRVTEFLMDTTKVYKGWVELGTATDTYDACGQVTQQEDPSGISREQVEAALGAFRGTIEQTPPMYSAVKHQGKRLYELARAGIQVERQSRPAQIYRIEVYDWQPPVVTIEVVCGKGTYIRSLAHDLGQVLGCGAHLKSLIRSRCGIFSIENAIPLEQLEEASRAGYWRRLVHPIDTVLSNWSAIIVDEETGQRIRNGQDLPLKKRPASGDDTISSPHPSGGSSFDNYCRAYNLDGRFIGVLRFSSESGLWHPEKIFL